MPDYELWIAAENQALPSTHAKDRDDALRIFGEQLGLGLTLEEDQDIVAPYMLRETNEKDAHWAKSPDIPVWVRGSR